jgi:phage repressor protein C with HTH and peptisase S24 domain
MEESGLGKRLREARLLRDRSQDEVGRACGVSRAAVAQWEKGTTAPTADKIEAICELLDIDPVWLLTGKHSKGVKPSKEIGVAMVSVPEYDVRASAGGGFMVDREKQKDVWPFSRRYIQDELRLTASSLVVLETIGDSMEPTLRSGDRVLVNMADKRASQPGIFVLWDGDGTVVKRIELVPNSKPIKLRRISDNPLHGSYEVLASDTVIVGRVVWFARRM